MPSKDAVACRAAGVDRVCSGLALLVPVLVPHYCQSVHSFVPISFLPPAAATSSSSYVARLRSAHAFPPPPRGGVTRQGIVLTELQSLVDCL
jgi:hypothetical protein